MSRKDMLRAILVDRKLPNGNHDAAAESEPNPLTRRLGAHVRSGAVGAMGRSLGEIAHAAEQARELIASGNAVVEIPPAKLEASFIADRLGLDDPDHRALVESIRERGQQVPILVRPHPTKSEHYQIAYGHRRVRALAELGMQVRAIVRTLSDEELVVAQGQENSARTDLSYIERARFAAHLEDRGFDRRVIMAALSMEKTQLSRLLAIARAIPDAIAVAIGPAPKAGRPRWMALAERLHETNPRIDLAKLFTDAEFRAADSDARFARVFHALTSNRGPQRAKATLWKDGEGRKVATIERQGTKLAVVIDEKDAPKFGEFLAGSLPEIYRTFLRQRHEEQARN
jgi:ParB family transcriptional regulator, chromosome partitioning protein